jgi:hypothetical protein
MRIKLGSGLRRNDEAKQKRRRKPAFFVPLSCPSGILPLKGGRKMQRHRYRIEPLFPLPFVGEGGA